MKQDDRTNITETSATAQSSLALPDSERRALLKRLSSAAVIVPVVTVLHDATRNIAHAS